MLTVLSSAMLMAGCGGGGGGGDGTTPVATGSSATGAITGFGSIIVGGVRFDDSAASVQDDDGVGLPSSDLKLGMVVRIKGGKKTDDGSSIRANAHSIEVHSELQGPVDSKAPDLSSIVVLGQTVKISATTFFDDNLTAAALKVTDVVEVHGFVNPADNTLTATRIELKPNAKVFKLQGVISALNATTFNIGTLTINYEHAVLPSSLTPGASATLVMTRVLAAGRGESLKVDLGRRPVSAVAAGGSAGVCHGVAVSAHRHERTRPAAPPATRCRRRHAPAARVSEPQGG